MAWVDIEEPKKSGWVDVEETPIQSQQVTLPPKQSFMPKLSDILTQAGMGAEYPLTYGQAPAEDIKAGINQSREYAPGALMTAGNLAGAATGIPGAPTFLGGLGFAGGEAIREGAIPSLNQFVQNTGKGFAYNLGGAGAQKVTSAALGGVREGLNNIAGVASELPWSPQISTARKLVEKGLPIAAAYINPTEETLALAARARKTYPGNQIVTKAHEQLRTAADDMITEFKNKFGINQFSKEAADKAFNEWADMLGGGEATLVLPQTQQFIKENIDKPFVTALPPNQKNWWTTQAATFLQNPTVQGLRDIWSTLGIKGASGADKTARNKLAGLITDELKSGYGEDAAAALDFAKDQNAWAKKVASLKGIINGSHTAIDGVDTFMPDRFARLWEQKRTTPMVFKNFTKDELSQIDEFASQMGLIGHELKQPVSDTGLGAFLAKVGALGGGGQAATNYLGIPGAVTAAGIPIVNAGRSAMAGRAAFNPNSFLYQNTIGNVGPVSEALPGLVNIGGKLILLKGSKALEELQ